MAKRTKDELVSEARLRAALDRARDDVMIPDAWAPEEKGNTLVGTFVESRKIKCSDKQGRDRTPTIFILKTKDGEKVTVWGSANLQPQMDKVLAAGITAGQVVAVTYDGKTVTSAGYNVKLYALAVIA